MSGLDSNARGIVAKVIVGSPYARLTGDDVAQAIVTYKLSS